jgi:hypothetical protein
MKKIALFCIMSLFCSPILILSMDNQKKRKDTNPLINAPKPLRMSGEQRKKIVKEQSELFAQQSSRSPSPARKRKFTFGKKRNSPAGSVTLASDSK